jgi:ABC-type nickel/cobalt efflux system permease component RcnA
MKLGASVPSSAVMAVAALALAGLGSDALAQSSLGIGNSEASVPSTGLFGGLLGWINAQQQDFYRALRESLSAMRRDGSGAWMLAALSLAYGVFHAAGPGHGKAVISSYMLANEVALRRGVMLSFIASLMQALMAILLMGAVFLILRGTAISAGDAAGFLETASYVLLTAFGAWLVWRKTAALLPGRPAFSLSAAHVHESHAHHHHHGPGVACAGCGHVHVADPARLAGERLDWRSAWSAIAAVAMRPCSGALIVLTFAFLHGLWLAGIASVFAMALGTAVTVSLLAILAVAAKGWAVRLAGSDRFGRGVHATIELAGAAFILLIGLSLLAARLAA